ncbi:GntR family transcriptional regulator [Leucobacter chinensis]|uniref:GntR family transcriptional regulator n=1 Tax=Leucobacter chinensis TaxID=2851010 RepID=UPI001C241E1B
MFDETRPIFLQLADALADAILRGAYEEGDQVPSTNELAAFHRINPATAGKGLNELVDRGVLEKRRGLGMFVLPGAKERIGETRQGAFVDQYVKPLLREAAALGISAKQLHTLIEDQAAQEADHDERD